MSTEHIAVIQSRYLYTKRDGKMMVRNPERWLKPTTSDQCGQNHAHLHTTTTLSSLEKSSVFFQNTCTRLCASVVTETSIELQVKYTAS